MRDKDPSHTQNRRRMLISITLALVLHAAAFLVVQYGIRADQEEPEEIIGPILVTLYEPGQVPELTEVAEKDRGGSQEALQEKAPAEQERRSRSSDKEREETTREHTRSTPRETGHPEVSKREPTPLIRRRDAGSEIEEDLYQRGGILEQWEKEAPQEVGRQSEFTESDQPYVIDREYEAEEDVRETGPVFPSQNAEGEQELALNMDKLDRTLEESRAGSSGGMIETETAGGKPVPGRAAGSPNIVWDDASRGRVLLSSGGIPEIPEWVKREGLDLKVEIAFTVTPDGHTTSLGVRLSSGYPDVDAAVLESVRKLRFNPIQDDRNALGRISYLISAE
jgi:TonB family protein